MLPYPMRPFPQMPGASCGTVSPRLSTVADPSGSLSIFSPPINLAHASSQIAGPSPLVSGQRAAIPASGENPDWSALAPCGWYARRGKRLLDVALLLSTLPIALPLALLVAIVNAATHRSIRKVFFTQPRVGLRNRVFSIVKFRTMKSARNGAMDSWSKGGDHARVTAFGRFLRNSHLDELPQYFNILRGDMGFIGPRPEMVPVEAWACEHVPGFSRRLAMRPGITGWAQITQGYASCEVEAYARKLELNDHYLRHLSFAMDFSILVRTMVWILRGRGRQWNRAASCSPADDLHA